MSNRGSCVPILHRVYVLNSDPSRAFLSVAELSQMESLLCTVGCTTTPMGLAPAAGCAAHTRPTRLLFFRLPVSSGTESHGRTTAIWDVTRTHTAAHLGFDSTKVSVVLAFSTITPRPEQRTPSVQATSAFQTLRYLLLLARLFLAHSATSSMISSP